MLWVKDTRSTLPTAASADPLHQCCDAQRRVIAHAAAEDAQNAAEVWVHCRLGTLYIQDTVFGSELATREQVLASSQAHMESILPVAT